MMEIECVSMASNYIKKILESWTHTCIDRYLNVFDIKLNTFVLTGEDCTNL